MPKTHRITLPEWQHRAALAGATAVLLPMKPQPTYDRVANRSWRWSGNGASVETDHIAFLAEMMIRHGPYATGDVLMCREAWANPGLNEYEYKLIGGKYRWQPASRMLAAACRLWLRVVRREALRVAALSNAQAMALGCATGTPAAEARAWWETAGGRREDWVWFVEVKREER